MRKRHRHDPEDGRVALAIARHPREFVGLVLGALATLAIFVNALFLQHGPHPAPIFASRHLLAPMPLPAPARGRANAESARNDPIAELLAPSHRVLAVQRALADFGYGQIQPTGVVGPETQAAIEKFERSRHMPVTGQISDRLLHELSTMTGRPLQ